MLLWSFALLASAHTARIGSKQNEDTKMNCGARFLPKPQSSAQNNHPKFLSLGGTQAKINELPFIAQLSIRNPSKGTNTWTESDTNTCSGVQISSRHIITAAHCVFALDSFRLGHMCSDKLKKHRIPMKVLKPELFSVCIGSMYPFKGPCCPRGKEYKVRKVVPHPGTDLCKPANDIAIIEVAADVSSNDGVPICMPEFNTSLAHKLEAAGFGLNPYAYSPRAPGLEVVQLTKSREFDGRIETADKFQSLCRGDSGGPLFQSDAEGRITLVGIASTVEPYCFQIASVRRNYFTDVRPNLQWICNVTGVCPVNSSFFGERNQRKSLSRFPLENKNEGLIE